MGDVDGDGNEDVIFGDALAPGVFWQRNTGGGHFDKARWLFPTNDPAVSITAIDFDHDEQLDYYYQANNNRGSKFYTRTKNDAGRFQTELVSESVGSFAPSAIVADFDDDDDWDFLSGARWVENRINDGEEYRYHNITNGQPVSVVHGDVDADGDVDLVMAIPGFGAQAALTDLVIYQNRNAVFIETSRWRGGRPTALALEDLDGDGYPELIVEAESFYPNVNGKLLPDPVTIGDPTEGGVYATGDINGDGMPDIVAARGEPLEVSIVTNDNLSFNSLVIDDRASDNDATSLELFDIDDDGRLDILLTTSTRNSLGWYRNGDDGWSERRPLIYDFYGTQDSTLVDLDRDGDLDIVSRNQQGEFGWYASSPDTASDFFRGGILIGDAAAELLIWDVDSDGSKDIVTLRKQRNASSYHWYRNGRPHGQFEPPIELAMPSRLLEPNLSIGASVAMDVDLDGDEDLVMTVATSFGKMMQFSWIENRGVGNPMVEHRIGELPVPYFSAGTTGFDPVDVDLDGDLDVVFGHIWNEDGPRNSLLYVFLNNGDQSELIQLPINPMVRRSYIRWTEPIDFDGDGDSDLIVLTDAAAVYYENVDGRGQFVERETLIASGVDALMDVDGDGDVDLLDFSGTADIWYENRGNREDFFARKSDRPIVRADDSVRHVADFDGDGRPDFVVITNAGRLEFFRNTFIPKPSVDVNDDGFFDAHDLNAICSAIAAGNAEPVYDVNQDNAVDRLDVEYLLSELGSDIADVNLDGRFDSADLVTIFSAGQYDRGASIEVTWTTGDWNCDGVFDSSDLVAAMQVGHYVQS